MVEIGEYIPDLDLGSAVGIIAYIIIFAIVCVGIGIGTFLFVRHLKFNKRITVIEKIAGGYEFSRKDKAMVRRFGTAGDTVFYLAKHKKFMPTPTIQCGRNHYLYAIREDGEWVNIGLEDIDEKNKELGFRGTDADLRYSRVSMQKNLRDRLIKVSFLEKYGGLMAYTALILVTGVAIWLLFDKLIDIAGEVNRAIELAGDVQELSKNVLSGLDNVCSGGSGLVGT